MASVRLKQGLLIFSLAVGAITLLRFALPMGLFFTGLLWAVAAGMAADLVDRPSFLVASVVLVAVSAVATPFAFPEAWRIFLLEFGEVMTLLTFGIAWRIEATRGPAPR